MLPSTASTTVRLRNRSIGTTGSGTRSSTITAATSAAIPRAPSVSEVAEPHANCEPASEIQMSSVTRRRR